MLTEGFTRRTFLGRRDCSSREIDAPALVAICVNKDSAAELLSFNVQYGQSSGEFERTLAWSCNPIASTQDPPRRRDGRRALRKFCTGNVARS
eukprot:5524819-Lingulodinium_polyedra.AAC.1